MPYFKIIEIRFLRGSLNKMKPVKVTYKSHIDLLKSQKYLAYYTGSMSIVNTFYIIPLFTIVDYLRKVFNNGNP